MRKESIIFSRHAKRQMVERGVSEEEVVEAVVSGERTLAKRSRKAFRKNFQFEKKWGGKFYRIKQVMPIAIEENGKFVVVTVYSFYF